MIFQTSISAGYVSSVSVEGNSTTELSEIPPLSRICLLGCGTFRVLGGTWCGCFLLCRWLRCRVPWCICLPMWFTSTSRTLFDKNGVSKEFLVKRFLFDMDDFFRWPKNHPTKQTNKTWTPELWNHLYKMLHGYVICGWLLLFIHRKRNSKLKKWCFNCCWQAPWHDPFPALIFLGKERHEAFGS